MLLGNFRTKTPVRDRSLAGLLEHEEVGPTGLCEDKATKAQKTFKRYKVWRNKVEQQSWRSSQFKILFYSALFLTGSSPFPLLTPPTNTGQNQF